MHIPVEIFFPTLIGAVSYIVVEIVKLKVSMKDRVTYSHCHENRKDCPCIREIKKINETIEEKHPRKN